MLHDLELQAKALAPVLKSLVSQQIAAAKQEIIGFLTEKHSELAGEFTKRFDAIPSVDVDDVARLAAAIMPSPEPGEKGEDGKSVTIDDIRELIAQAVEGIELPQAEPGEPGKDGDSVPLEDVQAMVEEAVTKALESAPKPADGNPGRDALELDILPRIDLEKSYTRGLYARHNGGLWRTYATTDGLKGWECIVAGIGSIDFEQVDERNIVAVVRQTDGEEIRKSFSVPTMIYRNVWREGVHQKGDVVTFGGCAWHCNEDTDTKPGENSKAWTLMVKKGRDGKV